jgi:hypothetical protein
MWEEENRTQALMSAQLTKTTERARTMVKGRADYA